MTALLELNNISTIVNKGTSEERQILKNLSLEVNQGDFITLLGTNGAGKSTLLNVINGALSPDQGSISLQGQDLTKLNEVKRAQYIAQVFQDPKMGTAPRMTVAENLLLAYKRGQKRTLRLRHLKQHRQEFESLTAKLPNGLSEHLNTATGSLSGGQRQTLSFLMATLNRPELLLLDEHTAALDPNTSKQLVQAEKLTCIMITHQLKDALKYGNRTIILNNGQVVLDVAGAARAQLSEQEVLSYFTDL